MIISFQYIYFIFCVNKKKLKYNIIYMVFVCSFCSLDFVYKKALIKHLADKRCKSVLLIDFVKLHNMFEEQKNKIRHLTINGDNNGIIGDINMKIEINVIPQPIQKLDVSYIDIAKIKEFIDIYDDARYKVLASNKPDQIKNPERINIALGDYIKEIIYNKEHPENHSVKYIKKDPPTFNSITEDDEGKPINVIKGLKDTCELLSDPILDKLKQKIREFIKKYKKDDDYDILYEDTIQALRLELNKKTVKKSLSSVLKNDILHDIEMKLSSF